MKIKNQVKESRGKSKTVYYVDLINGNSEEADKQALQQAEQRFVKQETKKINNIKSREGAEHYMHNALAMKPGRERELMILLVASVRTIKAKLAMPANDEEYYRKSFNMQDAIFLNTSGYFSPAFNRLATWATENIALDTALDAIENKDANGEALKKAAMKNLKLTLKLALNFVNNLVLVNQPLALLMIEAALMEPVGAGTIRKPAFTILQTNVSGSIKLISLAARKNGKLVNAAYEWEYSIDNMATWIRLPVTLSSTTIAVDMVLGKTIVFRRRITTREGTGEWLVSKAITPS